MKRLTAFVILASVTAFTPHSPLRSDVHRCKRPQGSATMMAKRQMAAGGGQQNRAKRELMERQRQMAEFNAQIETTPVFQVFASPMKMKGLWQPVAAFQADNVAKGVVDGSLQDGFAANLFKGVYKAQVESAVAKAIFDNEKRLREQGAATHAPLKNLPRDQWIWGFKILYKPYQDKFGKNVQPTLVTRDTARSLFDKFKDGIGAKVQETFNLKLEEPAKPATPAPAAPSKAKSEKKKKSKKANAVAEEQVEQKT